MKDGKNKISNQLEINEINENKSGKDSTKINPSKNKPEAKPSNESETTLLSKKHKK